MENETDPLAMGALNGQPAQPPQQPQQQPDQQAQKKMGPLGKAMEEWMKESYTMGMTGGHVVQSGLASANNSYSDLITSVMSQNISKARESRTKWKEAAEGTLAFNASRLHEYGQIWTGKEPIEDKMGMLREIAGGHYQDTLMAGLAEQNNITAIGRYLDILAQQQQKAEAATKMLEQQFAGIEAKVPMDSGPMQ